MNKKILHILIALYFSYLQAMDHKTSEFKTHILQGNASEITLFDLFRKKQIKPPYRLLANPEIYSYESPITYLYSDSKKINETQIIRPHTNQTIFTGLNPILILYIRTQDEEQTIYINPNKFFRSAEAIMLCTAILFAKDEDESSLVQFFETIKAKIGIENIKKWYIKTPVTTAKAYFAIILKQNPDESYLLLHDEQTINFNQI